MQKTEGWKHVPGTPAYRKGVVALIKRARAEGRRAASVYEYANGAASLRFWIGAQPKATRPFCGAKTRAGSACCARVVEGRKRCRLHGGLSTGPKTAAGRQSIVASNKRRSQPGKIG